MNDSSSRAPETVNGLTATPTAEKTFPLEHRFQALVASVKDYAIFMLDPSGKVSTWNTGAERIKGYSADEIIGQHFSRFYTKDDIEAGKPAAELSIAETEGQIEDEGWRVRKDGSRFRANVVITAVRDERGQLLGFSKVTRDVTERTHVHDVLRASEARFRSLFEFSPDAIIVSDRDGKIDEVNGQVQKFFGYARSELVGQSIEILVPERFRLWQAQGRLRVSSGHYAQLVRDRKRKTRSQRHPRPL